MHVFMCVTTIKLPIYHYTSSLISKSSLQEKKLQRRGKKYTKCYSLYTMYLADKGSNFAFWDLIPLASVGTMLYYNEDHNKSLYKLTWLPNYPSKNFKINIVMKKKFRSMLPREISAEKKFIPCYVMCCINKV